MDLLEVKQRWAAGKRSYGYGLKCFLGGQPFDCAEALDGLVNGFSVLIKVLYLDFYY